MIVLYILLGILGAVFLLLLIPLRLEAEYEEGLAMTVGYLFFRFRIFPQKRKRRKKKKDRRRKGRRQNLSINDRSRNKGFPVF